jgi:hypothetical protein
LEEGQPKLMISRVTLKHASWKRKIGGKVEIYDPQRGEVSFSGDKEDFRDYVKDDRDLLLYIVE